MTTTQVLPTSLRGKKGVERAQQFLDDGWCLVVVTDMPSEEARGYWLYEHPLSVYRSVFGDDLTVRRILISTRGEELVSGLELFLTLDSYCDDKRRVVHCPGPGILHTQMRHYRVPRTQQGTENRS